MKEKENSNYYFFSGKVVGIKTLYTGKNHIDQITATMVNQILVCMMHIFSICRTQRVVGCNNNPKERGL